MIKKTWTSEENDFVRNNYRILTNQEIADRLGRTIRSVVTQMTKLQVASEFVKRDLIKQDDHYLIPLYTKKNRDVKYAIIDECSLEKIKGYRWRFNASHVKSDLKSGLLVFMHNIILPPPEGMHVYHKDGNNLDNRLRNLGYITASQNVARRPKNKKNPTSKYLGIYRDRNRWVAIIKDKKIGYFATEIEAAKAYDKAAREEYGEFANPNFPKESDEDQTTNQNHQSF